MNSKKGMGAFLVATLVIVILVFVCLLFLSFIERGNRIPPDLINFVNRNYFKKDLVLFLDTPIVSLEDNNTMMSTAEFIALHFYDLKKFEPGKYNGLRLNSHKDELFKNFFDQSSKLAIDFCGKYIDHSQCYLELFTYDTYNKKQMLYFPEQSFLERAYPTLATLGGITTTNYPLTEISFFGPDGAYFILRIKLSSQPTTIMMGGMY